MRELPAMTFLNADGSSSVFRAKEHVHSVRALVAELSGRLPEGSPIGLLFRTGPALVIAWLASVHAGFEPLILQYPTRKQSRTYWLGSVEHTLSLTKITLVLAESAALSDGLPCDTVVVEDAASSPDANEGMLKLPDAFAIIQLSSGTTGFRKAIRFTGSMLEKHIEAFNERLGLGEDDVIVSWLPLYHDMGYVACFVMPLMLGIPVVMIDPMDWVARPAMLFDAIEQTGATTCYMPNFGFEVMSRVGVRRLSSMRRWISCSEPVSPETVRKFQHLVGAPDRTMFACYGMAENIFAVTYGEARIVLHEGVERVACGAPIPGVELRVDGGEIHVRSPTSLHAYLHGQDVRDADGFYVTGDLGSLVEGALVVCGRTNDLLVQAGRKIMLGDVDLAVNRILPETRGRAAAIAWPDSALGTELALILIEAERFFARDEGPVVAAKLREETGLEALAVAFVPPSFLTKTSSGKFNRREITSHWRAQHQPTPTKPGDPLAVRIRRSFQGLDAHAPVGDVLDSLSLTVLAVELADSGRALDPTKSLDELCIFEPEAVIADGTIRIVSLADRFTLPAPEETRLAELGEVIGAPVTFEHVCLPPSPIILSDLVFSRYFAGRLPCDALYAVNTALDQLRGASLIITDDMAELYYLYESTYPVLSHRLSRDPSADLISMRWQAYVREHHRLPVEAVAGVDIPMSASNPALASLSAILNVPIFRMASVPGFASYTEGWEYRAYHVRSQEADAARVHGFWASLASWALTRATPLARVVRRPGPSVMANDLAHFCASAVSPDAIAAIVNRYSSFALFGQSSSLPRLRSAIGEAGKTFVQRPSYAPVTLARQPVEADCFVACGAFGPTDTTRPFIALQHVGQPWRTRNLHGFEHELPPLNRPVESGTAWYREFTLDRLRDYAAWSQARALRVA